MRTKQKLEVGEIWKKFHTDRDNCSRNLLMEHYFGLVHYAAERLYAKLPGKVELDDLISAGAFGLMDAIDAYDPDRGVKFETYCSARIRGSILDELRNMDWVPRLVRARAQQLRRVTHALETHLGRKPSDKETAEEMKLDKQDFERLKRDANAVSLVSLNTSYTDEDSEKAVSEIDFIMTKGLTRAERLIVVLYYYEEMTMKEIGLTLDLSESRVSQMHSSIVARLKAQLNSRKPEFKV